MKETILLYHVQQPILEKIQNIAEQLHIHIQMIEDHHIYETMGYILGMEGFEKSSPLSINKDLQQEFVFFAGMSDQQLDILLQLFKMNDIPTIPYKAMLTQHNVHYTFIQLYLSVKDEYEQMSQMKNRV